MTDLDDRPDSSAVPSLDPTSDLLMTERAFLLVSIADLDREHAAGDIGEDDYRRLRDGYTARTADVLRAIEAGEPQPSDRPTRVRRVGKVLSILLTVALAGLAIGFYVARNTGTRLSGDTITGDVAATVNGKLAEARDKQNSAPDEAIKLYDDVIALDPTNPEALTYKGWLLVRIAVEYEQPELLEFGRKSIDDAIAANPRYADARAFGGIVAWEVDEDAALAEEHFNVLYGLGNIDPRVLMQVAPVDTEAREALGLPPRENG